MPDGAQALPRWRRTLDRLQGRQRRYKATFGGPDGKWVLNDLYRHAGMSRPPHVPGDPYSTAYQIGAQSMMLHIARTMGQSADSMLKAAQEAALDHD
jgi:hypothetical protein